MVKKNPQYLKYRYFNKKIFLKFRTKRPGGLYGKIRNKHKNINDANIF